jgi:Protein of unknown function (DUF3433)
MVELSQQSPPGGVTSPVHTANSQNEVDPNLERIASAASDGTTSRSKPSISSNDQHDSQASALQNPTNSLQHGVAPQPSTSVLSPSTAISSENAQPIESKPAPPSQAAESRAEDQPKTNPRWRLMNIVSRKFPTGKASNTSEPKEWKDDWLRLPRLAFLFLITIALCGTLPALCVLSRERNGLLQVSDAPITIVKYVVSPALAWTSLPVLLVTLYGMALASVVTAALTRQPYVELWAENEGNGSGLKQSILLDYKSYWLGKQLWVALKNRHLLLFVAITFTSIAKILLPSLTAHLFDATVVSTEVASVVTQNTSFNDTGFTYRTDLVPIFDIVSSTLVYGGIPPVWTTFNYSILNFSNPAIPKGNTGPNNFSVNTMAYSANLNCTVLDKTQYNLTPNAQGWQFQGADDRGCPLTEAFLIGGLGSQNFTYYMQSFATVDCDLDAGESRLVVLSAANFNGSLTVLTNFTAISCKTAYFNTSGALDVTLDLASSPTPKIQDFTPAYITLMENPRPEFWQDFEVLLHEASINDGIATTSATDFGRLIFEYARTIEPQTFLSSDVLLNSTESIFTAVYAVMAHTFLIQPTAAIEITGTLSISTTRLLVIAPIAYAITGILCAVAFVLVCIFFYVQTHKSILYEEPKGILGWAEILSKSDLELQVSKMCTSNTATAGKIVETVEKNEKDEKDESLKKFRESGWRINDWKNPQESRIVMTGEARKPQLKSTFKRNFQRK